MKIKAGSILKALSAGIPTGFLFLILFPYLAVQLNDRLMFFEQGIQGWEVVGITLIVLGVFLFLYSSGLFAWLGLGTPAPIEPPQKLVTSGVYKYTRNPMYWAYLSILAGEFLFFGDLFLLFYFLFIVLLINIYLRFWEEPALEKRFGKEYEEYKKRVPRWF